MKEIIKKRPKVGCNMITMLLHQDRIKVNHKQVERLYKENKMQLKNRKKGRKKYSVKKRDEHILTEKPGKWLAVDFVIDNIANKRQLKNLTVIDPVSKVTPRIIPAYSMQGEGVAEILNEIWNEEPFLYLQTDNGPEFRSYAAQSWRVDYNENRHQKGLKGLTPNSLKLDLKVRKTRFKFGQI